MMKRENNRNSQDYKEYLDYDASNLRTEWDARINEQIRESELENTGEFDQADIDQEPGYQYDERLENGTNDPQVGFNSEETYYDETGQYRSRHDYHGQTSDTLSRPFEFHTTEEHLLPPQSLEQSEFVEELEAANESIAETEVEMETEQQKGKRTKYSPKVDRFLTNGIIVVTVLLIAVLLIAFLV